MTKQEQALVAELREAGRAMATQLKDYASSCGNSPRDCPGCTGCRPAREALARWAHANWRWHRATEGRVCAWCSARLDKWANAKQQYCSTLCRQAAWRKRRSINESSRAVMP